MNKNKTKNHQVNSIMMYHTKLGIFGDGYQILSSLENHKNLLNSNGNREIY